MKRVLALILLFFLSITIVWSQKTKIPKGWMKNDDIEILGKGYLWLHVSSNDSICINLINPNRFMTKNQVEAEGLTSELFIHSYSLDGGVIYSDDIVSLTDVYTIEKNDDFQIIGQVRDLFGKSEIVKIDYELASNNRLLLYNLPQFRKFDEAKGFRPVRVDIDTNAQELRGGWYHSGIVDSTVFVFDDVRLREYLFVTGTTNLVDRWEYGEYQEKRKNYYVGNKLIKEEKQLEFRNPRISDTPYSLNPDHTQLTIYWASPGKTTTYTKIKK